LPTAWQAVQYAAIPDGGTVAVYGLGPIGQMSARIALHQGASRVFGIDLVPERLEMAARHGIEPIDARDGDPVGILRERTDGRGPDSVIDAVGMEAHGSPIGKLAHQIAGMLPDAVTRVMMDKAGIDRLSVLYNAIDAVRRGGTISLSGVYGGSADPMPMMDLFDKQIQLRMGQANVRRWVADIRPLLEDDADPLGVEDLATHKLPLDQAPHAYEIFQRKQDGAIKILLQPQTA
jgi:threonine dehydrogenase-like Zn-dependent dehydrogenase